MHELLVFATRPLTLSPKPNVPSRCLPRMQVHPYFIKRTEKRSSTWSGTTQAEQTSDHMQSQQKRLKVEAPQDQEHRRALQRLASKLGEVMATHTETNARLHIALPDAVQVLADQPLQTGMHTSLDARQRAVILDALGQLKVVINRLLLLLARNTLPEVPDFCKDQASPEFVRQVITYAHKLCFTTFAPPGYTQQTPLRHFRPPAPQEWQMHSSLLHAFARKEEARQAAAKRGLSAAQQAEAAEAAAAQEADREAAPTWAANQPVPKEEMQDVQHAPEVRAESKEAFRPAEKTALMDFTLNPADSESDVEEDFSSSEGE